MKRFLALPEFEDDDLNIRARLIYLISAGIIFLSLVFVLIVPSFASDLTQRALILAGMGIPASGLCSY